MSIRNEFARAISVQTPTFTRSSAATALLPRYLSRRASDVITLRDALTRGDFASVFRIGHNLRGSSQSYGFPELAALGEHLEAAASASDRSRVQELTTRLETWSGRLDERRSPAGRVDSGVHFRVVTHEREPDEP